MDAAARFCLRHTLDAVHAALIFKLGVRALARNHGNHFLETADAVFIKADNLHLPSLAVRIV